MLASLARALRLRRDERDYLFQVAGRNAPVSVGVAPHVAKRFADHKTLIHPELGAIELACQALFTEDQSQALLVLTAPPRTEGYEKLQLLAVVGQENFTEPENAAGEHFH
jgi:hypothetical protein